MRGRHSAALDEQYWDAIATFALDGNPTGMVTVGGHHPLNVVAAYGAPVFWLLGVIIALIPAVVLGAALGLPQFLIALALFGWITLVAAIVTSL